MDENIIAALSLSFIQSPEAALKYLKTQGVKITWDADKAIDAIKEHSFTVSKVANADVLQTILEELTKSMDEGKPYSEFKKELDTILEDKGYLRKDDGSAWRLNTIYRNNLQSAYMAGRFAEQMEVIDDFPWGEFVAVIDNRTTDGCEEVNGVIAPLSDPFWDTNYPQRHHHCRSRVVTRSDEYLKLNGKKVSNPKDYQDIKPAKGFDTKPGEWVPDLTKYDTKIKRQLNKLIK